MRKILAVLVMILSLSVTSVFSEPLLIQDADDIKAFILTDTEYPDQQKIIADRILGWTDFMVADYLFTMFHHLYESKGYTVTLNKYTIAPVGILANDFKMYTILNKYDEWVIEVINLGDGRQITFDINLSK